jgi:hypothetical protein
MVCECVGEVGACIDNVLGKIGPITGQVDIHCQKRSPKVSRETADSITLQHGGLGPSLSDFGGSGEIDGHTTCRKELCSDTHPTLLERRFT